MTGLKETPVQVSMEQRTGRAVVLLLAIGLACPSAALPSTMDLHPLEPPDTSSPRATFQSFLGDMQEASDAFISAMALYRRERGLSFSPNAQAHFDRLIKFLPRARHSLNLSEIPPTLTDKVGLESALLLKEIFDRVELPALESVPDAEALAEAGTDRWRIPHTEIVIAKVTEGARRGEFLFSPATIERLPEFYEKVEHLPYKPGSWEHVYAFYRTISRHKMLPWKLIDQLPSWAKVQVWEQALWRWIVFGIGLSLSLGGLALISRWIREGRDDRRLHRYGRGLLMPITVSVVAWLLRFVIDAVNMTGNAHYVISTVLDATLVLALAWAILLAGNLSGEIIVASPNIKAGTLDEAMAKLGSRILAFVIAAVVTLYGAQSLGLPIVPLLAGLGVGGLALALAAQPTIENFIAGLTLYADRPVRVGEFCRFGDTVGTVEEIGMRSTRIRTLGHTIVAVPNADFSKARLENFTARGKIWFHPRIRLRYETTPDQVRYILVEIRKLLYAHPKVHQDPARIRFVEFGAYSLDLDVFAYIDTTDYAESLEIAEDLNLRIMDVIKAAGTELAIPAQIEYRMDKAPLDEERTREAQGLVKEWRAQRTMYLPKFPPEKIAELRNSLEYPPAGSPLDKPDPTKT